MTPLHVEVLGTVGIHASSKAAYFGIAPPATFAGAISLVASGAGRRLRVDLTATEAFEVCDVLGDQGAECKLARWDHGFVVLSVGPLELRLDELLRDKLAGNLQHRAVGQQPVAGEVVV
jgi:hypothetical protein